MKDLMSSPFWIVVRENTVGFDTSSKMCHVSEQGAIKEAERLAMLNPGIQFYVFAAVGVARYHSSCFKRL